MTSDARLITFIEAAKARGASDDTVGALLRAEGWSARAVHSAFREYYERTLGLPVPARGEASESARDAFLYLLAFCTLGAWTIALASLAFTLLNSWLTDALFDRGVTSSSVATEIACVIVAFPVFAGVMRTIAGDVRRNPERLEAGVTKWLTWLALLIAAGILIGDLVTFLSFLLRGEVTARFVGKVAVVLLLAGGVFWYYLNSLRNGAVAISRPALLAATAAALLGVVAGLFSIGPPARQRALEADRRIIEEMSAVEWRLNSEWGQHRALPRSLDTRRGARYLPDNGPFYRLCAEFRQPSEPATEDRWKHPMGYHCFPRDASAPPR